MNMFTYRLGVWIKERGERMAHGVALLIRICDLMINIGLNVQSRALHNMTVEDLINTTRENV